MVKPSNAFVAGPAMFGFLAPGRKHLGEAACQQPVQGKKRVRGPSANGGETGSNSPSQRDAVSKSPLPHAAGVCGLEIGLGSHPEPLGLTTRPPTYVPRAPRDPAT